MHPLANTVAVVSNLEERCRAALEPVNRDPVGTGYPHLVLEPVNLSVHGGLLRRSHRPRGLGR
jgi:hypothetical protein